MLLSEERMALACMHVFHKDCIMRYADCKGEEPNKCCPYKCSVNASDVAVNLDEEVLPTEPDAAPSWLERAARVEADSIMLD